MTKFFGSLAIVLLLVGCGGGGSEIATSPDLVFDLTKVLSIEPGDTISFSLTGSDSAGGKFTGSIQSVNRPKIIIDGQLVTQRDTLLSLTNTVTGAFVTVVGTSFVNENREVVETIDSDGVTWTPTTVVPLPVSAQVGSFGLTPTFTSVTGESLSGSWRFDPATATTGKLVFSSTTKDISGNTLYTEDDTYTITADGTPQSFSARVFYPDMGVTVSLSGPAQ
jgi:hypothetical protein